MAEQEQSRKSNLSATAETGANLASKRFLNKAINAASTVFGPLGKAAAAIVTFIGPTRALKIAGIAVVFLVIGVVLFIGMVFNIMLQLITGGIPEVGAGGESITLNLEASENNFPDATVGITIEVIITVTVTNNLDEPIYNIHITSPDCDAIDKTIDVLEAGATSIPESFTCVILVTDENIDDVFDIKVFVTGVTRETDGDGNVTEIPIDNLTSPPEVIIIGEPEDGPPVYWPLKGPITVTRPFGFQHPIYECGFHLGTDIVTGSADWTVYSPYPGPAEVRFADNNANNLSGYGKYVDIESGIHVVRMAHMDPIYVSQGDIVEPNTAIGRMDATGIVQGNGDPSHVHFEVGSPSLASGCDTSSLIDAQTLGLSPHP